MSRPARALYDEFVQLYNAGKAPRPRDFVAQADDQDTLAGMISRYVTVVPMPELADPETVARVLAPIRTGVQPATSSSSAADPVEPSLTERASQRARELILAAQRLLGPVHGPVLATGGVLVFKSTDVAVLELEGSDGVRGRIRRRADGRLTLELDGISTGVNAVTVVFPSAANAPIQWNSGRGPISDGTPEDGWLELVVGRSDQPLAALAESFGSFVLYAS